MAVDKDDNVRLSAAKALKNIGGVSIPVYSILERLCCPSFFYIQESSVRRTAARNQEEANRRS